MLKNLVEIQVASVLEEFCHKLAQTVNSALHRILWYDSHPHLIVTKLPTPSSFVCTRDLSGLLKAKPCTTDCTDIDIKEECYNLRLEEGAKTDEDLFDGWVNVLVLLEAFLFGLWGGHGWEAKA